jgi:hypothetical protein
MASDRIPVVETYRGVGIHVFQPPERIALVKREIDHVYTINDIEELWKYADSNRNSPESRLFAIELVNAMWAAAEEKQTKRPDVDIVKVRACVIGLDTLRLMSSEYYTSSWHPWGPDGPWPVKRETPLTDEQRGRG